MGDTVFTPLYEVLRKRGVNIKFFHQVKNITLHPDNKRDIDMINIVKQVKVQSHKYQPLISVKNLLSWPDEPRYVMIDPQQSTLLRENKINLESFWSYWPQIYKRQFGKDFPLLQLKKGREFDTVVYGISIASLPHICSELLHVSEKLKNAHSHLKTCATQAFQIWTDTSLAELGWKPATDAFLDGWREPLHAYAAMNQVLDREDWASQGKHPKHVAYFCSQLNVTDFPHQNVSDFPETMSQIVKQNALRKLSYARDVWPNSFQNGHFNWTMLTSPPDLVGIQKFDSQFWRANIDPSELYVQSPVNSSIHRIETDGTEFRNIYFTGDWIATGINMGCAEMQTADAIIKKRDSMN